MTPKPDIAAVVLNYRTPDKTLACLHSMVAEGLAWLVLVENSEDAGASLAAMQPGLEQLRSRQIRIDVLDKGRNLGFAAGVNLALSHIGANTTDVLLLNSDARLQAGSLAALGTALDAAADVAAPMLVNPKGEVHAPVGYYHRLTGLVFKRPQPGTLPFLTGACMLLSRRIVAPDLFDEAFFFYGEDVALAHRLRREGRHCVVVDDARVTHEGSGSSRNGSLFYEYNINKSHWLLATRLARSRPEALVSVLLRIPILSLRAGWRSLSRRSYIPARALLHLFFQRST